jgi:starch phosphorylase
MLTEALPIYSGGLGNVAGDQLKSASDLGVPVIGVGLLYQQGYFRQRIDAEGRQHALYPFNDPGQLPVTALREGNGEWLRIPIQLPGCLLRCRAWQVQVGQTRLYLLDSNDPANLPEYRGITSELYGGGPELRLLQERVLGVGGWRLLRTIGIRPEVCHLNEGHSAFVVLERARCYMEDTGASFEVALAVTRAGNLFTTHTPVEAGFDRFPPDLVERHLRDYAETELRIPFGDFLALGRVDRHNPSEPFNMAYLAIRGSGAVNAVSRLHGRVSRRLFQPLFPRWPDREVPVAHITNGIHVPTWDSVESDELWTRACGKHRWRGALECLSDAINRVPAAELWTMRMANRRALIEYVRKRFAKQLAGLSAGATEVDAAGRVLDPDSLTLGFARRFVAYKRPNLLLRDPERLLRILTDHSRPVQLIIAGKAHPEDCSGQDMIHEWIQFIRHTPARRQIVFLTDYDMHMAQHLVQGVDVWLNMPRRPWEACGTSGMKVLANGGLNLSEMDGWWAEAYAPDSGWAFAERRGDMDLEDVDAFEATELYEALEQQVIPEFYDRDEAGVPVRWVGRMRCSMARLTSSFSANRSVREYTEKYYLPCASEFKRRSNGELGAELVAWQHEIEEHWSRIRFGSLAVETCGTRHVFRVHVYLDELPCYCANVELYADPQDDCSTPVRQLMTRGDALVGSQNGFTYVAEVVANRPASDYTPRLIPYHPAALVPLESQRILWCR